MRRGKKRETTEEGGNLYNLQLNVAITNSIARSQNNTDVYNYSTYYIPDAFHQGPCITKLLKHIEEPEGDEPEVITPCDIS